MLPIIPPVDRDLLAAELTPERRLRATNKAGNEIYVFKAEEAPNAMREVGRLREIAFRAAGGGTGKNCDIDEFDGGETPYYQLIVWSPEDRQILGGYRFLPGREMKLNAEGQPLLATTHTCSISRRSLLTPTCAIRWSWADRS